MLPLLMGIGVFSALLALLQVSGDPKGILYWYAATNHGSAVGLLANRNHHSIFLASLFPMMAVFCSINANSETVRRIKVYTALGISAILIPLILVVGSRAGLIAGIFGILCVPYLYRPRIVAPNIKKGPANQWLKYGLTVGGVIILAVLTILMSRGEAFQRLLSSGDMEGLRLVTWKPILTAAHDYFR